MEFVISVGAGLNQVPFIERLVKKGYKVIAFDLDQDAPGKKLCYAFKAISTWNYDEAIQWLVDLGLKYIGVGSFSYGKALVTEKKIANYFNLLGELGTDTYSINLNKNEQQKKLFEFGFNKYKSYLPHEIESLEEINSFIVKPLVGGSSEGIQLLSKQQLLDSNIDVHEVVIEPFLEGEELRVSSIIQNGSTKATFVMKRENLKDTFCIGRQQPADEYNANINKLINRLISTFSIRNSALKLDIIATTEGLEIVEIDFGIAGDRFETHLSWDFFEYNYIDNYINLIVGKEVEQRLYSTSPKVFSDHIYNLSDGFLTYHEETIHIYLRSMLDEYKLIRANNKVLIPYPKSNMDSYLIVIHKNKNLSNLELNEHSTKLLT
ncbi:ATP-grasp domain-containing protein [Alkalicoccobacillus murimartini]|uniref:ATP-grasp superfamily ATP-dependent carboligase n=1 Tax=Alkalicoccobacillus murimartini TaxID=171685 RepID=A0ABT9YGW1_9BACI|nr:ATP-grasp domain-containing protein [Alkalicoccobacillus murimartini]MDQ0206934.1 putative ATP-grasp superfamily ATP-dependent carboligase [Alkalicoccobacillus murimartini]